MADSPKQAKKSNEQDKETNSGVNYEESSGEKKRGDASWRDEDVNKKTGDPGRTPGKAEGEDDPAYYR